MRRDLGIVAGATAVAAAIIVTAQTSLHDRPRPDAAAPVRAAETLVSVASSGLPPPAATVARDLPAQPTPDPERETRIADLTTRIEQHEVEFAELQAALADRDATLAAREAEISALRGEIKTLRQRLAFELQFAAVKNDDVDAAAVAQRTAAAEIDAVPVLAAAPAAPRERPMTAIHFETGSARLTPGGQAHAAAAAVMLADMPFASIRVNGYADRTGSPARNRALAEDRARTVADFLVAAGLPADRIETTGTTEPRMLPVATDAGVAEPLNRAATITPVPPPIG